MVSLSHLLYLIHDVGKLPHHVYSFNNCPFFKLAGGVVLGFGIYALVQDSNISQMVSFLGSNVYLNGLYIMVTAGSLTILISFLGCCGALREHRPFLCLVGF